MTHISLYIYISCNQKQLDDIVKVMDRHLTSPQAARLTWLKRSVLPGEETDPGVTIGDQLNAPWHCHALHLSIYMGVSKQGTPQSSNSKNNG